MPVNIFEGSLRMMCYFKYCLRATLRNKYTPKDD